MFHVLPYVALQRAAYQQEAPVRGPGRSPPPIGFYIGILIKSSSPKGGVHKLMILLRDLPKDLLRKLFGEEMGGVRGTQTWI